MTSMSAKRIAGVAGVLGTVLMLAGCGGSQSPLEAISPKLPPPDEFQVVKHSPLEMPASLSLPEPTPGAPSPRDPQPQREAIAALLGNTGSRVASDAAPSAGEQVLLSSANAAATSSDIRVQLETDKVAAKTNKPYEPPSLGELLGFTGSGEKLDETELIDPQAEAQRLQREGIAAPADPDAAAAPAEAEAPQSDAETPSSGPPRHKIAHEGTAPAN